MFSAHKQNTHTHNHIYFDSACMYVCICNITKTIKQIKKQTWQILNQCGGQKQNQQLIKAKGKAKITTTATTLTLTKSLPARTVF